MSFIVTNVECYKPWMRGGTVVNHMTNEPRQFPTRVAAQSFCDLSMYRAAKIVAAQHETR